jgi:Protein of unknown function (DUF4058)
MIRDVACNVSTILNLKSKIPMPNPFPGMNPYLENPDEWPQVHHLLISSLLETLVPQLLPKYIVTIDKRIYQASESEDDILVGLPDVSVQRSQTRTESTDSAVAVATPTATPVEVRVPMLMEFREGYLEVRETKNKEVVTVIELLSPANKRPGQGRKMYEEKRQQVLGSRTHLVEIDLLRGWKPLPVFDSNLAANYRILVSRGDRRPKADLYLFNLSDAIPTFPLPLRRGDVEPVVELQSLINQLYDRAGYDYIINYNSETVPKLSESEGVWVDTLLREKGLR